MYQKIKLDKFSLMLKNTISVQKVIKEMNLAFCAVIFFVVLSLKKSFEHMPYYNRNIFSFARSFLQKDEFLFSVAKVSQVKTGE